MNASEVSRSRGDILYTQLLFIFNWDSKKNCKKK